MTGGDRVQSLAQRRGLQTTRDRHERKYAAMRSNLPLQQGFFLCSG